VAESLPPWARVSACAPECPWRHSRVSVAFGKHLLHLVRKSARRRHREFACEGSLILCSVQASFSFSFWKSAALSWSRLLILRAALYCALASILSLVRFGPSLRWELEPGSGKQVWLVSASCGTLSEPESTSKTALLCLSRHGRFKAKVKQKVHPNIDSN